MRLLAIDPGSKRCAFAFFVDGELVRTELVRTDRGGILADLRYIADQFRAGVNARGWYPDVVAIEAVYVGRNALTALSEAETVGYLERVLDELWPRRVTTRVARAKICHALGLKGNANGDTKRAAGRARFPELATQDEVDAAAVGITAIAAMGERSVPR